MADISEWSTVEAENTHIDELTLSGESGQYINKVMCAVKAMSDDVDANVVHKTGDETIGGDKILTGVWSLTRVFPFFNITNTDTSAGNGCDFRFYHGTLSNRKALIRYSVGGTFSFTCAHSNSDSYLNGPSVNLLADGSVKIVSKDSSSTKDLLAKADGTLTWDGQAIQTASDERVKTPLAYVPDEVLDAWGDVQWGQFQYLDAVAEKGASARLHLGLVAQRVKAVFEERGLDACDYGILCHEERPAVDEETVVVDAEAYTDKDGTEHPAVTHVEVRHEDAVDLWMVRYAEAQAMEAAFQRRRADRLERRIEALEASVNGVN